ncbi:phytanoyl-CoA dioxygenase family protein [Horticoccus luteus]|uniref:Phytanoyl-CoA dioxygenase family protein n=1 Tax=Horticoccus luteus TaxID=2862869 RepID=A0A8F9XKB3_9BACT|nr:phytanoyl-CoA dioxygenase family protein [Horticoccus luteus]QYM78026.1 phytanoyl-CoA dioxygenase family protein [Horticoccus luteus]
MTSPLTSAPVPESPGVRKVPFVDSTPLLGDADALRARAADDGFLFFKHFLPVAELFALRKDMLAVVERHGWRQPGQDALGGRINLDALNEVPEEKMRTDIGVSIAAYDDVQKLESFHRLPHHPKLLALYRTLFGSEVLVHPRHIGRMITGHKAVFPTPPHQDFPLIQGTAATWTCWFPLGDCPRSCGGLTILKGSHRAGYIPIQPSKGAGGIAVSLCPWETEWAEGDYEAGDIITFPSHTVHKALRCQHKDLIRLSLDVRYQSVNDVVEEKSLKPHCDLTWEQIYAGWSSDALKYYWQRQPLTLTPWNDTYLQPSRRIC